ncbi:MAG: hypothetical protein KC613_06455, partial [Myxococcales bacterium]|nr:hypothetical protein [Myxococcales bacterium]
VDVTVGRQIVAWGEGDALSVLDVVNPRDNREPGLADLDDLRLAVLASRVSWFTGAHRFELMGIHEAYFGEFAPPLADFSPFRALVTDDPTAAALLGSKRVRFAHAPERWSLDGQMALARWVYKGPGLDLGLYAASVLDRTGVVVLPALSPALLTADTLTLTLDHQRYTLVGTSGATAVGAWLLKWELAGELDKAFNAGDPAAGPIPELRVDRGTTLQAMASVGYTGIADLQIFVEVQKGFLLDGPDDVLLPVEAPIAAVRATYSLLRERLQLAAAATAIGWTAERGWLVRGQAQYQIGDGFSVSAGYISYQPGRSATDFGPFYGFEEHDRLFTQVRWDFLVPVLR